MRSANKKQYVRVVYEGQSTVCGITKNTTCDDVIRMVLDKNCDVRKFELFESVPGTQHISLDRDIHLYKQVELWGANKYNVSFVISKKVETAYDKGSEVGTPKSGIRLNKSIKTTVKRFEKYKTVTNLALLDCCSPKKAMAEFSSQKSQRTDVIPFQSFTEDKPTPTLSSILGKCHVAEDTNDQSPLVKTPHNYRRQTTESKVESKLCSYTPNDVKMKFASLKDYKTRYSTLHDVTMNAIIFNDVTTASNLSLDSELDSFMRTRLESP